MTDNIFKDRFNKKPSTELEAIAKNDAIYTDEARLTALEVLKSRDYTNETLTEIFQILNANAKKHNAAILEAEQLKDLEEEDTSNLPALHSKRLILMFSIFFSTIFGGALLMYNFKQTGHSKARLLVLLFCIVYAFVPILLMSAFNVSSNISVFVNVAGGFILTEYFWNTYLGKTFVYKKRDWIKPTLIALAIAFALVAYIFQSGAAAQFGF